MVDIINSGAVFYDGLDTAAIAPVDIILSIDGDVIRDEAQAPGGRSTLGTRGDVGGKRGPAGNRDVPLTGTNECLSGKARCHDDVVGCLAATQIGSLIGIAAQRVGDPDGKNGGKTTGDVDRGGVAIAPVHSIFFHCFASAGGILDDHIQVKIIAGSFYTNGRSKVPNCCVFVDRSAIGPDGNERCRTCRRTITLSVYLLGHKTKK